jgi:hypothetical protein
VSKGKSKTHLEGRSAKTGRFMPVEKARGRSDAVVERVPNAGYGDTDRGGKKPR